MLKAPSAANWQFGKFSLMPDKRLLLSDGAPVPLMSKAFDVLVLLVENRDRVMSKDELLHAVWPNVVVEEGNLTQQVFLLRKALGESAQEPRYIVTVPGHGYRFTAPVTAISPDADRDDVAAAAAKNVQVTGAWRERGDMSGIIVAGILAALVIVFATKPATPPPSAVKWLDPEAVRIRRITETGRATHGTMSPDGRYVAYIENEGDEYSLHVQRIATGARTTVIPRHSRILAYLRFSPDSEFLYFARRGVDEGAFVLSRVPSTGGPETPVLADVDTPIDFSPDERHFVFMRGAALESQIVTAEAGGATPAVLAALKGPRHFSPVAPAWSPDGKWVAAAAADESKGRRSSIVLLSVDGGSSRELYTTDDRIGALRWQPDGSGLLTVLSETLGRSHFPPWQGSLIQSLGGSVWRIAYPGGASDRLTSDLADYDLCCIDIAADGRTIAGVVNSLVSNLWIAPAKGLDALTQITRGSPAVARHSWLDSDTIVYGDLSGRLNAVHKDQRTFSLAVPDGHKVAGGVSACGNGRYIVFPAVPGNNIWRVTSTGGGATRLTSGSYDLNPACSPDGKWLVYSSRKEGVPSAWRIPIDGGEPAPLGPRETFDSLPSPSGRLIYYSAFERDPRMRWIVMSSGDGKRLFTLDAPVDRTIGTLPSWAPDESGLDYVVTRNDVSNIWRQPLTGGPPVQVTHFSSGQIFSFAWSPDARWLSLGSGAKRSDVVLISRK